jgi:hypothetical protein
MPRELRDDGRTYHDVTHARAVREARADVVEKARAFANVVRLPSQIAHAADELRDAVRALEAAEQGEP